MADFLEYVGCRATDLFPAGVRYYAEGAVFAAAFHDGNKGCGAVYARLGQTVELFNFRKRNVDLWLAGGTYCVNHFGQPVQRLWAKDHIYIGCTVANCSAFLAGNTATNANNQLRVGLFEFTPASNRENNFSWAFLRVGQGFRKMKLASSG